MCFVEAHSRSIKTLHLRSYESDSIFIESLPALPLLDWLRLEFRFQPILWRKGTVNCGHLVHLELHRVDFLADDDPMEEVVLRASFKAMSNLLVLSVTECRWQHAVVLPPQIKFLRFTPSDLSVLDMTRIADRGDTEHTLPFKVSHFESIYHSVYPFLCFVFPRCHAVHLRIVMENMKLFQKLQKKNIFTYFVMYIFGNVHISQCTYLVMNMFLNVHIC